ncbi:MAG TPA: RelA/SpoT domain-containing protein, partial [Firmicutes bacterium]|nr:RelA/SpoT domain-containing protein [Bacillota bacterium]
MSVISDFIRSYKKNMSRYETLAQTCAQLCERELKRAGLRVLVTHRAKRLDSLLAKVESRSQDVAYGSVSEIYEDILDLAGVRIALYFPKDRAKVDAFLRETFLVDQTKDFPQKQNGASPYPKRFSGYSARHYRLRMKAEHLPLEKQYLSEYYIELQVGSVLMHAWAEIEHDLVYKSTPGVLSHDEYAILDELNGLMHAGEIALERLQRAVKRRVNAEKKPFANHYELSSFLHDYVKAALKQSPPQIRLGRTDVLFRFLQLIDKHRALDLNPILNKCSLNGGCRPLCRQITDRFLNEDPAYYRAYNKARLTIARTDPFAGPSETISLFSAEHNCSSFLSKWITLEETIGNRGQKSTGLNSCGETENALAAVKQLRDQLLYG